MKVLTERIHLLSLPLDVTLQHRQLRVDVLPKFGGRSEASLDGIPADWDFTDCGAPAEAGDAESF